MPTYVTVTFTQPPGRGIEYTLTDSGNTVSDLLNCAEVTLGESNEIRVNGEVANMSRQLKDGDKVMLTQKIKGA